MQTQRTGAQALIKALIDHGASHMFCVPGESYLAALDALYDARASIRLITCRQEGGAANMAEAYGKLTGRPGLCFVTRGPGATNAAIGVHTAFQDSTPLILLIGQAEQGMLDREAFQEVDFKAMFTPLAKWAAEIREPDRIPEYLARAFHVATSGRPGPVVLSLPEDVLLGPCSARDARPYAPALAQSDAEEVGKLHALLVTAQRPLLLLGGPGWTEGAIRDAADFARRHDLPVLTSFRAKDRFDNTDPNYCGDLGIGADPKLVARLKESDLVLVIGARLGEMTTDGYTRFDVPNPVQKLIHVHPCADELGHVYQPDLAIVANTAPFMRQLRSCEAPAKIVWQQWRRDARADYEAFIRPVAAPGPINPSEIYAWLNETLPADAILTNGAGNFAAWLHRFYLYRSYPSLLGPTSGAMGYGVPAAVAAKLICPERLVVCAAGDGDFLMNGQELATAVQYDAAIIVLVFDNGTYGTIRMHQERNYPGRVVGTELRNPDFALLARSYGALGFSVTSLDDFKQAFAEARAAAKPCLLHLKMDAEAISPTTTLTRLRQGR